MGTKDPVLSVRLPGDLDERLDRCAEKLDLSKNDIARHAIRAAVEAIEANGFRIELPLKMSVAGPVKSSPAPVAFVGAGEKRGANVDGPSSSSLQVPLQEPTRAQGSESPAVPKVTRTGVGVRRIPLRKASPKS